MRMDVAIAVIMHVYLGMGAISIVVVIMVMRMAVLTLRAVRVTMDFPGTSPVRHPALPSEPSTEIHYQPT